MSSLLPWGPRDYVKLPEFPKNWRVIDVGPGAYPLTRANLHVDRDPQILAPIGLTGKETLVTDINENFPGIADKSFDYAWCSHVLEHVEDPVACAAALTRIARAGTIVMPSTIKDALFNFEEVQHLWHVLPHPSGLGPIFVRHNRGFVSPLEDDLVKQAMCFLFRTGSNHDCTAERHLRAWYQVNEPMLDVVYHWRDELKLTVIAE